MQLCSRNGSASAEKKRAISPLAKDKVNKRFSFDSVGKKPNFCAKDFGAEITLLVSNAPPLSPQPQLNESGLAISPGTIRRDNIDGCESEKDSSDIGERTNAGFSGDEDEGTCDIKSGDPMEDLNFTLNYISNNVENEKDSQIGDPTNNVMANTNSCTSSDVKEEMESDENDATMDPNGYLAVKVENVNGPLGTKDKSQGVSEQLGTVADQHIGGPTISDHNDKLGIDTTAICRDQFPAAKQDDTATVPKSDSILESTTEGIEIPLKNLAFNGVLDDNDNCPRPEEVEESSLAGRNSEINYSLDQTGTIASQDEEKMNLSDRNLNSVVHDASVEAKALVFNEESVKDAPAYKKKLQRKKDKTKNDRIEKTFFV